MCLDFWSLVLQTYSVPLQHEFRFGDVHWKTIDVSLCLGHKWVEGFMVEAMEPIRCVEGGQKVS
jgi:hypothetical protein